MPGAGPGRLAARRKPVGGTRPAARGSRPGSGTESGLEPNLYRIRCKIHTKCPIQTQQIRDKCEFRSNMASRGQGFVAEPGPKSDRAVRNDVTRARERTRENEK